MWVVRSLTTVYDGTHTHSLIPTPTMVRVVPGDDAEVAPLSIRISKLVYTKTSNISKGEN